MATLFHVGIVVPELGDAMASLARDAGVRWRDPRSATMELETADGRVTEVLLRYVFSEFPDGSVGVELVEAAPGTIWEPNPAGIHHVGHWTAALDRESRALHHAGCSLLTRGRLSGMTSWMFAYHQTDAGLVELVDESRRSGFSSRS